MSANNMNQMRLSALLHPPKERPDGTGALALLGFAAAVANVLTDTDSSDGLVPTMIVGTIMVLCGFFGIRWAYYWLRYRGLAAEEIAAYAAHGGGAAVVSRYPHVPSVWHDKGRWRAHRLEAGHEALSTVIMALFTVAWSVGPVLLWWHATDWGLYLFAVLSTVPAIGLVWASIRGLLLVFRVPPTVIEVSKHPLEPGDELEVVAHQRLRARPLEHNIVLLCEEMPTWGTGTNSRSEVKEVLRIPLVLKDLPESKPGKMIHVSAKAQIPEGAMHSLKLPNNDISWWLVFEAKMPGAMPNIERKAELVVFPPESSEAAVSAYRSAPDTRERDDIEVTAGPLQVRLLGAPAQYRAGDRIVGRFVASKPIAKRVSKALIVAKMHTSGKGTTDSHDATPSRRQRSEMREVDDGGLQGDFEIDVPVAPCTYDGSSIKLHWVLHVRLYDEAREPRAELDVPIIVGEWEPSSEWGNVP